MTMANSRQVNSSSRMNKENQRGHSRVATKTEVLPPVASWRYKLVVSIFAVMFLLMIARAIFLQIVEPSHPPAEVPSH